STTDLTRRIDVRGNDEISDLANTFNQMLDELEEGFKSEKQFLDDVGHELRTPITVVRGHLETMGTGPEDRQKTLALVTDELDRMARFVNDLLMLARSERPDFLHLETVDVGALTDELFVKAATMAQRTWVLEECGRGIIEADRQRLTQALLELARNATKHTSEGDQISIGSKVSAHQAEFWVTDCGEGVPTADRERIFQRFQRGDRARKGSGDSGLGLAIVTAIAEAHHGRVELDTESGCGATFRLVIPTDQPLNREGTVSHA
ncbi:MAG TPA: HAMP domain-containing sensor histidine kinase, partial [Actinomycetota bacterium]|nr:HAMP domain-containing sensor histidine kinase [Actinomycetota bacterium]